MGRLLLVLGLCVAVYGFSLRDLSHAGNAVAEAFRSRNLLDFEPVKNSQGFKLQDVQGCNGTWWNLAGMLQNISDPCNSVLAVLQNSLRNASWSDSAIAFHLNKFCAEDMGACLNKYTQAYDAMTSQCGGFNPQLGNQYGVLGNKTDYVARTVKALVNAMCLNETESWTAPPFIEPLSGQNITQSQPYTFAFCWMKFTHLVATNPVTANTTILDGVCTPCAKKISDWFIKNAPNQLAVGARQARSFCDKNPIVAEGGYCMSKVLQLQYMNSNPAFADSLKNNPNPENLKYLCHPCVKWGIRLNLRIQDLFQLINSQGYNETIQADLKKTADGLSVSCMKNPKGKYCGEVLSRYLNDTTVLLTKFKPCIKGSKEPPCTYAVIPDPCDQAVLGFYREIGCCLADLRRSLTFGSAAAYQPTMNGILASCKFTPADIPPTCSQKKVTVTFPLKNVAHAFVQRFDVNRLKNFFARSIGIDPADVIGNVTCTEAANKSTTCVVNFYPDDTASATTFVTDFQFNVNNGFYLDEFDIASFENNSDLGGARITPTDDAYDAASFSATETTTCLNAKSPANYQLVAGECVGICENNAKDGDESDVDCGGTGCVRCGEGKQCANVYDCNPSIPKVECSSNCSDAASSCSKKVCRSFATALMANPLIILIGCLISLLL